MIGRIYKLEGNGLTYYGSTTLTLQRRLQYHYYKYKQWLDGYENKYTTSFDIIKGEHTITLLEEQSFETKKDMWNKERYYIENFECVNKAVPNRTAKEYNTYYKCKNKEEIKEKLAKKQMCECGCEVSKNNQRRHLRSDKHLKKITL
jgi:hypothetical protein